MSLKQKTISGIKWTTISTIISTLLQLLQLSILAKLLSPSDFGLMAIVMVVIGFSRAFLDMGISNAIIHKQNISNVQLSTLYWINVLSGIILFFIILLIAPLVSQFYHEEELVNLIILVGISFLIQPFGQQFMILWQKEMRFNTIAKIEIINRLVSLIISVYLAYKGYGVYALVYASLVATSVQTIQYIYYGLREYKLYFVFSYSEVKEFMSFGLYQMGERIINYFNYQIDTLLIGKLLGVEVLGVYNIAKQIVIKPTQIINPIITKVTFPAMSKIQNDINTLKKVYLKVINYLSSVNFIIYVFIIVFAKDIVLFLFGEKWLSIVYIIQILSIWAAIRSTGNPIGSLLLAKGKANWGFWWNFALFFYVPLGIYIGSHWGIIGISWSLVIMQLTLMIANWYFLVKNLCNASFIDYFKQILIPFIIAFVTMIIVYIISLLISSLILKYIASFIVGIFSWLILNYFLSKEFLLELNHLFKNFIRIKK